MSGELDGPHVRLGVLWAVLTFVVALTGRGPLAAWCAVVAAAAAMQAARSWRGQPSGPPIVLAGIGGALLPIAAAFGAAPLGGAVVGVLLAAVLWRPEPKRFAPKVAALCAVLPGLAMAGPVLLRDDGAVACIVLLSFIAVYDASAFLVGAGASRQWEGPAAGIAAIFAVTLAVAALFVPPFSGIRPWAFGALAAALAPLGPLVANSLVGNARARVPALRRVDSLLLAGPVWAVVARLVLH